MRIPKTFMLGGNRITISYKERLDELNRTAGCALYDDLKIVLLKSLHGDNKEQTFLHEVVHHILNTMGEATLRQNEQFVDVFATFLHQYMKTAE
jgi:hypothetical protein